MGLKHKYNIYDIIIITVLTLLMLIAVFPFYNMLLISLAKYEDVARPTLYLWPKSITLINYQIIFSDPQLMRAFKTTFTITVFGTALSMFITTTAAYSFSQKDLPGRNVLFNLFIFTMYFGGGLIPWYLVLRDLGFIDNILVMIVPNSFSVFNMILMKNYFNTIPDSLEESAKIDGANDIRIMLQIVLPVAKPILATVALFYAVAYWNEWWLGMLFIVKNTKIVPLQLLLRRIVVEATMDLGNQMANAFRSSNIQVYRASMQMASITVATVPILLVYPFVQKYFAKGIMLGAIKA